MTDQPGWTRHRIKFVAEINRESLSEATDEEFAFDYVDIGRVSQGQIDPAPLEMAFGEAPSRARRLAEPGDTIVSTVRTYLRAVATVGRSEIPQVFSTGFAVLHPLRSVVHPGFLSYYLQSDAFVDRIVANSVGVSYPAINASDIAALDLQLPEVQEQRSISDFLDRETAQIDALIEAQRDLVARLTERRAALIADAVLLGEDPLHLSREPRVPFAPLGYGFSVTLGKMLDAGRAGGEADSDLPYLRAANIQDAGLDLDDVKSMPFSPTEARMLDLRAGDVLVVEGGAVGTSLVLNEDMPGWSFQKTVNRLRCSGDWEPEFASYVLQTYRDSGVIDAICNKSTIPHLTAEKLRSLRVPAPDPQRQQDIVRHLNRVTAQIDVSVQAANDATALMRERRSALISAAVTGRIDPRTRRESTPEMGLESA